MDEPEMPPDDYLTAIRCFRACFASGQYELAARHISFSLSACLDLATPDFFHELVTGGHSQIFAAILFVLGQHSLDPNPLLDAADFTTVCKNCDSKVIGAYASLPSVELLRGFRMILDRDDPPFLLECLKLLPGFITAEPKRLSALRHVLDDPTRHPALLEELWILIDAFDVTDDDLVKLAQRWPFDLPVPSSLQIAYEMYLNRQTLILSRARESDLIVCPYEVENLLCPNAMQTMYEASQFRHWLDNAPFILHSQYSALFRIDLNCDLILVQLPWYLMNNDELLRSPDIRVDRALFGQEAKGTGPIQDMFAAYFLQLSKCHIFETAFSEESDAVLPAFQLPDADFAEACTLFYGLGIVLLKVLIDRRGLGSAADICERPEGARFTLHPWFFRWLQRPLVAEEDDGPSTHELFTEELIESHNFYSYMHTYLTDPSQEYGDARSVLFTYKIANGTRRDLFQAFHDGFNLVYVEGLTPSQAREPLTNARRCLNPFYSQISTISHNALHLLLIPPAVMSVDLVLARFEIRAYEHFDPGDSTLDALCTEPEQGRRIKRYQEVFDAVVHEWCNEYPQTTLRSFLMYLTNSPVLSPLPCKQKWIIAVDSSYQAKVLYAFGCDYKFRIAEFSTAQEFKDIVLNTIELNRADAISRDAFDVDNAHDTFAIDD
jgi:hypothetical protein